MYCNNNYNMHLNVDVCYRCLLSLLSVRTGLWNIVCLDGPAFASPHSLSILVLSAVKVPRNIILPELAACPDTNWPFLGV